MNKRLEEVIIRFHRLGQKDKAQWLETIDKRIPESFKERIKNDDKTVLRELILPEWLDWDLLRTWALDEDDREKCILCEKTTEDFIIFNDKIICKDCLTKLKKYE